MAAGAAEVSPFDFPVPQFDGGDEERDFHHRRQGRFRRGYLWSDHFFALSLR